MTNIINSFIKFPAGGAFDLSSTVTYSGNSFSVGTQEIFPDSFVWNDDGTKFYVSGFNNKTLYEYTVSVGYDLGSTVAYSGNSFLLSSQDTNPTEIAWNADGTKFFMAGNQNNTVYEYTCSVGFDLSSTVAYSGNSFSVGTQEATPTGLFFNPGGTKFFIVGDANNTVYEYTCSVGFDLSSTVAYSGNSFAVTTQESASSAVVFKPDGTKFFIVGTVNDSVFEYTVSVAYDLSSTVAYSGNSYDFSAQDATARGFAWNDDGLSFFIVGDDNDTVYEYNLS